MPTEIMNFIWLALILISIIAGAYTGRLDQVTKAAFDMAGASVTIAIGLIGVMTLWLGLMKIAEDSGLIHLMARLMKPLSRRLFPDIPDGHPAIGAILLNLSANWLGLSNAATPLGLKAMAELQKLNDEKDTASDDMVMFLSINTASIMFVPATMLAVRLSLGSQSPQDIIGPSFAASLIGTVFAVIITRILSRLPTFRMEKG